jgi:60 kDa SS-A/Ro ribonucleoprotein
VPSRRNDPLASISTRHTPQSERADERQVPNSAGGFAFELDPLARVCRFLTLGVDGGTYYARDQELARENAQVVIDLVKRRGLDVVSEIVEVSESGRAPKNQPALFALAIAVSLGDVETRRAAATALPRVARTGTHLMQFVTYVRQFRGWGRVLDRAIENWYLQQDVQRLAYQVVKYRQREGWTHRDLLRLAHAKPAADDVQRRALFDWICHRERWAAGDRIVLVDDGETPKIIEGFERAQRETNPALLAQLVAEYRLPWEALPTEALNQRAVWEALLELGMPQTALMRQLPRLTNLGLLPNVGGWTKRVCAQLVDPERLKRGRVHPVNVLVAHKTYAQGHGVKGSQTWNASRPVIDALDAAFYAAYGAVRATGKRLRLALDVSGSMGSPASGLPISCAEASAALALVTANVESEWEIVGFSDGNRSRRRWVPGAVSPFIDLDISPRQRLNDVVRQVSGLTYGGTDCALPMTDALARSLEFDAFMIYTDNETWAGNVHPHQALTDYRQRTGIHAALAVVGMTSTGFTIGDPNDAGTLNVVGFDSTTPNLLSDFVAGDV